jgi:uncharacterized protein YpmS
MDLKETKANKLNWKGLFSVLGAFNILLIVGTL